MWERWISRGSRRSGAVEAEALKPSTRGLALLLAAALLLSFGAWGCGGDEGGSDSADSPAPAAPAVPAGFGKEAREALKAAEGKGLAVKNREDVIANAAIPDTKAAKRALASGAADAADSPTAAAKRRFAEGQKAIAKAQAQSADSERQLELIKQQQQISQCVIDAGQDPDAIQECISP